jgi:hypothetical protein
MAETVLERADAHIAESIHKLSRATSAMSEAIDDGAAVIKRAVKQGSDAAEEIMDDTLLRVKRHPVETIVGTFTMGVIVGGFIGWLMTRRY